MLCDQQPERGHVPGIIERVRRVTPIPYRPYIPPDVGLEKTDRHWRDLLARSWEENPINRMNFSQVKTQMKIINGGKYVHFSVLQMCLRTQ